jgi:methylated-DNA-[protein]-cysteine S-methyltransferase
MDPDTCHTVVDTPIGPLTLVATADALREVRFPNGRAVGPGDGPDRGDQPVLALAARQLDEYFAGERLEFDVPLDPQGSPFQLAAWRGLSTIPYGETVSYGEQARRLGHDGKARAIGAANGSNPLPVIVPCHRVIGSDGSLTGFGGGLELKAWLLHHEREVLGLELPVTPTARPSAPARRR